MSALVIRGGTLLRRMEDRAQREDLVIRDGRIVDDRSVPSGATTIDASGCYVMPGLVQTHVHLVQTIFRGVAEDLSLLEWLRTRVWPLEAAHDDASIRASVRLGLTELLLTGTTTILDMGTTHHEDAVADEIAASGIRARFGKAMMDAGDGVPRRLLERTQDSLDESARLAKRWKRDENGRLGYAFAPRFALSCTRGLLEAVGHLAREAGALIHTHSNENASERELIERATGRAPAAYLADVGIASERAVLAHGVHLDDAEVALLAERRTAIAHCPSSNLKLGSGIADVVRLRDAGVTVGIGADGAACNNRLDGFVEARLAAVLPRAKHGAAAMPARTALEMATLGGARALGLAGGIGTLEAGKRADVVILDGAELAGPGGDAPTRVLFGGGSRAVRDVIIDGTVVVRDRRLLTFDADDVRAKAAEAFPALVSRAGLAS